MLVRYILCIKGGHSFGKACYLIFESGASFDESIPLLFRHLNDRECCSDVCSGEPWIETGGLGTAGVLLS